MKSKLCRIFCALVFGALLPVALRAQPPQTSEQQFTVTANTGAVGIAIPPDFLGLSFETADTLPKSNGTYPYFRASNHDLINLFHTLGIRSLRIGGNTSDRPGVPVPDTRDIDHLFAFAKAADAKVIYTLRLRDSSPEKDAPIAKYLEDHYAADLSCLVIGNEPDIYEKQYPRYRDDLHRYLAAILTPGVAPDAKICGPSTAGHPGWSRQFVSDFGPTGHVLWITQHAYFGGNGKTVTDPAAQRQRIISPQFADRYEKFAQKFVPAVEAAHMQYRIEETNSFYNGGAKDVSNTFASSLWALKYLYWWAAHKSQGVNFHTGDFVAAGPVQTICWYGIFHTLPGGGYEIRPIAYAMKAFDLTSHGSLVPVSGLPATSAVSGYAVVDRASHELYFTLINDGDTIAAITLNPKTHFSHAESMLLAAPDGNLAATTGVTLGGAQISGSGQWSGKWSHQKLDHGDLRVTLKPRTALLLKASLLH